MEVMTQDNIVASAWSQCDDITQIQEENKFFKRQIGDLTKKKINNCRDTIIVVHWEADNDTGASQKEGVISVTTRQEYKMHNSLQLQVPGKQICQPSSSAGHIGISNINSST